MRKFVLEWVVCLGLLALGLSTVAVAGNRSSPKLLPLLDLTVKNFVGRGCTMWVEVENNGGPIPEKQFNKAKCHFSLGPKTKQELLLKDVYGAQRVLPGSPPLVAAGKVRYNTGIKVPKKKAASLSWIDIEHHIPESNEINNGDDATLACPATK